MGRGTKTTDFLKECMADALLRLMEERPPAKITVREITDLAGVGRVTWFRNFASKEEALTCKLLFLWQRYADEHALHTAGNYTARNAADFFAFTYGIRQILETLCKAGLQICIYEAFYRIISFRADENPADCYRRRFYAYGLFGLLTEWQKRDWYESPTEMTRVFYHLIGSWSLG